MCYRLRELGFVETLKNVWFPGIVIKMQILLHCPEKNILYLADVRAIEEDT